MNENVRAPSSVQRRSRGQLIFLSALVATGLFFLGWAVVGFFTQNPKSTDLAEKQEYLRHRDVRPLSGPLTQLLAEPEQWLVKSQTHALLGSPASSFELSDHRDQHYKLDQLLSKGPVVLVFYYGYSCNHCVGQLFALSDDIKKFRELGAEVVAISADPPQQTRERFQQYGEFACKSSPIRATRWPRSMACFILRGSATRRFFGMVRSFWGGMAWLHGRNTAMNRSR